ncbi:MAG: hypothetical protein IT258_01460 [Saprospiraceae bacterium]|nr:hypothetical protein [Saprospiraceae bacterium]
MKKQFKVLFFVAFGLIAAINASGQNYSSAIGARLGYPLALSYKMFVSDRNAVELYGGFQNYSLSNSLSINGAYQIHNDIDAVENLQWYYGVGAGLYFWSYDAGYKGDFRGGTSIALQGYLGLEYTFEEIPVCISADWIPSLALTGGTGFGGRYAGLGVRYILGN